MRRVITSIAIVWGCCVCVSCSQKKPVAPPEAPLFIGTVENVYPKYKYAMIYLTGGIPEEGTVLLSQSSDPAEDVRTANLVVGAERLGSRVPADIRSGTVQKGDLVFQYKNMTAPVEPEVKETPESILGPDSIVPPTLEKPKTPEAPKAPETPNPLPSHDEPGIEEYLKTIPKTLKEANKLR